MANAVAPLIDLNAKINQASLENNFSRLLLLDTKRRELIKGLATDPDFKSDEMTDCYGEYRAREGRILLQHDVCGQEMCNVMFHEILHAIVYGSGLNQANGPLKEEDAEELTVNQMTNYIMGVFKDNRWMLDFLKQNLDKSEESI